METTLAPDSVRAALSPLVDDRVRMATGADAVRGLQPIVVATPADEEQVAALLAFANRDGLRVLVRGGGTQEGIGTPPTGGDILLRTTGLTRIVEHTPGDLTATVQAGMPLAAFQQSLHGAGQWLALDPPLLSAATIGGLVSTNASGPRRLRFGGVRDQIIGVRIVRADGTIAKGGGKVVKNVAGYDLPKLLTGSLGTVGVIVAVTFRLYPLPASSRTVTIEAPDPAPLCDLALQILGSTFVPTAVEVIGPTRREPCRLGVRFETIDAAADDQAEGVLDLARASDMPARVLRDTAESAWWEQAVSVSPGGNDRREGEANASFLLVKASLLPTDLASWLGVLDRVSGQAGLASRWRASAGHGLAFVRLDGDAASFHDVLTRLREAAASRRGSLVVLDATPALLPTLDVWGHVAAIEQMRAIKRQFDPRGTLNPGRFVGGI